MAAETYEIKLILYRDCTSMTAYDNPGAFTVFNAQTNAFISNFMVTDPVIEEIEIDSICYDVLPDICVERGTYTMTINLPDIPEGYLIVYQRCCRNADIINIEDPEDAGFTVTQKIPGTDEVSDNNSPVFSYYPPIVICTGEALYIDNSAADPDGDSLGYSFFMPFDGASIGDPQPLIASTPPYVNVVNTAGFSFDYPLDASPPLEIDPVTGIITGTATALGRYVVGIVVKEYRDGELLSEHFRDFEFNVQDCSCTFVADIEEKISSCGIKQVTFNNYSLGTSSYLWDFGDGTTSGEIAPTHIYADFGTYYVKMIAEPGDECEDPSYSRVKIIEVPFIAEISYDGELLTASAGEIYQWFLNDVEITDANDQTYIPLEDGNYKVSVTSAEGCTDISNAYLVDITGLSNITESNIRIYPNPSNGDVHLEFGGASATLKLFNATGTMINAWNDVKENVNIHIDEAGVYFIRIESEGKNYFASVVIN
ncbi:MAG: PKD domain-containing protein [Chitinophagales bacterium]